MITHLVLYATLGVLCSALGLTWDSPAFWCVFGMFWAVEHWARQQGFQIGVAQGVTVFLAMTPQQQEELRRKIKEVTK